MLTSNENLAEKVARKTQERAPGEGCLLWPDGKIHIKKLVSHPLTSQDRANSFWRACQDRLHSLKQPVGNPERTEMVAALVKGGSIRKCEINSLDYVTRLK
jgi:hypothetical protein